MTALLFCGVRLRWLATVRGRGSCGCSRRNGNFALRRIVNLVLQIQMLVPRKHMRHIRHQLRLILNQRIRALFLRRVRHRRTQTAQHHRTHPQRRLAQIRHLHIRLERAHAPRLIFAHDKFQMIISGSKHKPGVVLHIFPPHLLRAVYRQLHRVAQLSDWHAAFLADPHFANDVDRRVVLVFFRDERNLRSGHDEGNRQIIM